MTNSKIQLEPEKSYHIFNHANGNENLFIDHNDYQSFLIRYIRYIEPIAETYAYCLMPNHFHFFLRIKEKDKLLQVLNVPSITSKVISYRFSHCFNSYAQAFNKKYSRMGGVFKSTFERKVVNTEKYFIKLIHYIHSNPLNHGIVDDLSNWEFSSYNLLLNNRDTFINRDFVLEYFGGKDNFRFVHKEMFNK